jgi:hypothetical protein
MDRLARALVGEWDTAETMETSEFFPKGGSRHGRANVRLVAGGTTLLDEVHSDGSAGPLDGLVAIWWDPRAATYRFFVCFDDPGQPCRERGTAHWERDTFVNEYEESAPAGKTRWQDVFRDITPTSHTLVAGIVRADGTLRGLITTRSTRRSAPGAPTS